MQIDFLVDNYSDRTLTPADYHRWAQFVSSHNGNYCQDLVWQQVLSNAYQLKTHFLMFLDGETPAAVFPMAEAPGVFARRAISLPYCNYGGILFADGVSKSKVLGAVMGYLEGQGIRRLEVRELCSAEGPQKSSEVTLVLNLSETAELLWKRIGVKVRNQIRKAERAGLTTRWGRDQATDLYDIYADNMGRLGTPVHSKAFVDEILNAYDGQSDVLTVRSNGMVIAAMLVLKHDDTWIDPIASSRTEFNHLNPNMLLYWEALRQAIIAGANQFDFGRSHRDSGTYRFKRQWGAIEYALDYHSYVNGVRSDTASTDLYRGGKAALFAKLWSKLPRFFQRFLGPKIRRYIP